MSHIKIAERLWARIKKNECKSSSWWHIVMTVTNRDKIQNYSTQVSQEHLLCNEFDWIIFSYVCLCNKTPVRRKHLFSQHVLIRTSYRGRSTFKPFIRTCFLLNWGWARSPSWLLSRHIFYFHAMIFKIVNSNPMNLFCHLGKYLAQGVMPQPTL